MNLLIGREFELSDGATVKVKMAQTTDYNGGAYERLYRWLCEVDDYLMMRFDAYSMEDMKKRWLASAILKSEERMHRVRGFLGIATLVKNMESILDDRQNLLDRKVS